MNYKNLVDFERGCQDFLAPYEEQACLVCFFSNFIDAKLFSTQTHHHDVLLTLNLIPSFVVQNFTQEDQIINVYWACSLVVVHFTGCLLSFLQVCPTSTTYTIFSLPGSQILQLFQWIFSVLSFVLKLHVQCFSCHSRNIKSTQPFQLPSFHYILSLRAGGDQGRSQYSLPTTSRSATGSISGTGGAKRRTMKSVKPLPWPSFSGHNFTWWGGGIGSLAAFIRYWTNTSDHS